MNKPSNQEDSKGQNKVGSSNNGNEVNRTINHTGTLSLKDFILGFLVCHLLFGLAICISIFMFVGPFYYSINIGLFVTIPYYIYI
jgi:hypothetical protein